MKWKSSGVSKVKDKGLLSSDWLIVLRSCLGVEALVPFSFHPTAIPYPMKGATLARDRHIAGLWASLYVERKEDLACERIDFLAAQSLVFWVPSEETRSSRLIRRARLTMRRKGHFQRRISSISISRWSHNGMYSAMKSLSLQSGMLGVLFDEDLANYVENVFAFFPFRSALPCLCLI